MEEKLVKVERKTVTRSGSMFQRDKRYSVNATRTKVSQSGAAIGWILEAHEKKFFYQ